MSRNKPVLTVKELIHLLGGFPADFEVRLYRGRAYDDARAVVPSRPERAIYISDEDEDATDHDA